MGFSGYENPLKMDPVERGSIELGDPNSVVTQLMTGLIHSSVLEINECNYIWAG